MLFFQKFRNLDIQIFRYLEIYKFTNLDYVIINYSSPKEKYTRLEFIFIHLLLQSCMRPYCLTNNTNDVSFIISSIEENRKKKKRRNEGVTKRNIVIVSIREMTRDSQNTGSRMALMHARNQELVCSNSVEMAGVVTMLPATES